MKQLTFLYFIGISHALVINELKNWFPPISQELLSNPNREIFDIDVSSDIVPLEASFLNVFEEPVNCDFWSAADLINCLLEGSYWRADLQFCRQERQSDQVRNCEWTWKASKFTEKSEFWKHQAGPFSPSQDLFLLRKIR